MAMSQQHTPPVNKYTGSYTEDADGDGVRMNAFDHEDVDISFHPLSANRRFSGTSDLAVLGTLVFAGPTRESIDAMVPDCIVPPAGGSVRVDLRHHVSLSLGQALDMAKLGTGAQYGEGLVSVVSRQHAWTPDDDRIALMSAELLPHLEGGSEQPWMRSTPYKKLFYGRTHK